MPRNILGQGRRMTKAPPFPCSTLSPVAGSTISTTTPGNGFVTEPGLVGIAPGTGAIIIDPVSVCHQVSTIGHFSLPIFSKYQIQASGFKGSPTLPKSLKLDKSFLSSHSSPHFIKERIAVGAV